MTLELGVPHIARSDAPPPGMAVLERPSARRDGVYLCPYDLLSMPRCQDAVMCTEAGGVGRSSVCVYLSVAKTDRGLDFVCHHPGRPAGG